MPLPIELTLPHENPAWIYEEIDETEDNYEDWTGEVLNRSPKQIQENVEALRSLLSGTNVSVNSVTGNHAQLRIDFDNFLLNYQQLAIEVENLKNYIKNNGSTVFGKTVSKYRVLGNSLTLANSYTLSTGAVDLFVDGVKLALGADYTESSNNSLLLAAGLSSGLDVIVCQYSNAIMSKRKTYNYIVPNDTVGNTAITIPYSGSYVADGKHLLVFVDGVLLSQDLYVETDVNTVTFVDALSANSTIQFLAYTDAVIFRKTLTADTTVHLLDDGQTYLAGNKLVDVYAGGLRAEVDVEYYETGINQVTFLNTITAGQEVVVVSLVL